MSALEYARAIARARRDIATAKEIRFVSAVNRTMREYFEAISPTEWRRLTEGSWG